MQFKLRLEEINIDYLIFVNDYQQNVPTEIFNIFSI